jgi:hypothetical protein
MYVRTLRQMREHRRFSPLVIGSVSQMNIAAPGGKQLNVVQKPRKK